MDKYDSNIFISYKLLYYKLIDSNIIDQNNIPNIDDWENPHIKLSWKYYKSEMNKQSKFVQKILKNNPFYIYMNYLENIS